MRQEMQQYIGQGCFDIVNELVLKDVFKTSHPILESYISSLPQDEVMGALKTLVQFLSIDESCDLARSSVEDAESKPQKNKIGILTSMPLGEVINYKSSNDIHYPKKVAFRKALLQTLGIILPDERRKKGKAIGDVELGVSSLYVCDEFESRMYDTLDNDNTAMILTIQGVPAFVVKHCGLVTALALVNVTTADGKKIIQGGVYSLSEAFRKGEYVQGVWKEGKLREAFLQGQRTIELEGKVGFARLTSDLSLVAQANAFIARGMHNPLPSMPLGMSRDMYWLTAGNTHEYEGETETGIVS